MTADEFSLDALIDTVRASVGPDAADIAAKVQPQIPEAFRDEVLCKLLVNYIRTMKPRLTSVLASAPKARSAADANPSPIGPARPATNKSAKVAGFQQLARALAVPVSVGRNQTKVLGDCTYDDLMHAANNRRDHAAQTIAAADEYEAWAILLRDHGKATVSALPKRVLAEFVATRRAAA